MKRLIDCYLMKQILIDFVNLFYPKKREEWRWPEIIYVLGMIAFLIFITIATLR